MGFNFNQLRRSQIGTYMNTLPQNLTSINVTSALSVGTLFSDKVLQTTSLPFEYGKSYYLKFRIYKRSDSTQIIAVKLKNSSLQKDNIQELSTITVGTGASNSYVVFEMIISPNNSYNQVVFELGRVMADYNMNNGDGTYGRKVNMAIENCSAMVNIISNIANKINNKTELKQIGVQGNSGLLMSINGEGIRVGRSGIYEINNGMPITSIGFVVLPNDNQNFILDYQY